MSDDVVLLLYPNYSARAGGNRELSICKICYYRDTLEKRIPHPILTTPLHILMLDHTQMLHISKSGLAQMEAKLSKPVVCLLSIESTTGTLKLMGRFLREKYSQDTACSFQKHTE